MMNMLVAIALSSAPDTLCDEGCKTPRPEVSHTLVAERIDALLKAEGLTRAAKPVITVRRLELDDNGATAEALVDVIAPELCSLAAECPTLIVQLDCNGSLATRGHGRWLQPLSSRSQGWPDLAETMLVPIATKALKFDGKRYR